MPISGGKYVAPTWNNGSSPAVNAAELQAISDTLVAVQTRVKAEVVSYTGTGTFGSSNPCSVTFSFAPDFVLFLDGSGPLQTYAQPYVGGSSQISLDWLSPSLLSGTYSRYRGFLRGSSSIDNYAKVTNSNMTISWYNTSDAASQLNYSGNTYYFLGLKGVTAP